MTHIVAAVFILFSISAADAAEAPCDQLGPSIRDTTDYSARSTPLPVPAFSWGSVGATPEAAASFCAKLKMKPTLDGHFIDCAVDKSSIPSMPEAAGWVPITTTLIRLSDNYYVSNVTFAQRFSVSGAEAITIFVEKYGLVGASACNAWSADAHCFGPITYLESEKRHQIDYAYKQAARFLSVRVSSTLGHVDTGSLVLLSVDDRTRIVTCAAEATERARKGM